MSAPIPTLRKRRDKRRVQRNRHRKAFRVHRRAVRFLGRLIKRRVLRESRPSPNFSYAELNCKDGTPVPKAAYKGLDHLCLNYLEPLRKKYGAISVTSGYRHQAYNAAIGGASQSVHIYDFPGRDGSAVAADVVCRTGNPQQWGDYLKSIGADGVGIYNASGFVHVDNRGRMGWPDSHDFGI